MGKHILIIKGSTCSSAVLLVVGKGVSLFIPCTVLRGILLQVTITGVKVVCVSLYKAGHSHKCLCMVLPIYSKI